MGGPGPCALFDPGVLRSLLPHFLPAGPPPPKSPGLIRCVSSSVPSLLSGHQHPRNPEARALKVTPLGRKAMAPARTMARARLAPAGIPAVALWLLCTLGLQGTQAGPPPAPPGLPAGADCLNSFTAGVPGFVLDTNASVSNGATFLESPTVRRGWDCVRACCTTQNCNLALVELQPDRGEDAIAACFLINCLYEQNFVCKFAPREGFINYLTREVYRSYRQLRTQGFGGEEGAKMDGFGETQKRDWLWGPRGEEHQRGVKESSLFFFFFFLFFCDGVSLLSPRLECNGAVSGCSLQPPSSMFK